MKPYYETPLGKLYHGDCLEIMPELEPVDLVLTDPPYGISYKPTHKKWNGEMSGWQEITGDSEKFNPEPFMIFNNVILWGANNFSDSLPTGGWVVWDKRCSIRADKMIGAPIEMAWTSNNSLLIARIRHGGVINADSVRGNNLIRYHPTQKPIALMIFCIESIKNIKNVLDPFLGSGTTAIACERLKRRWIGIEIEEKYCEIAAKRIEAERKQLKLF